jgi:hypothetical protein
MPSYHREHGERVETCLASARAYLAELERKIFSPELPARARLGGTPDRFRPDRGSR